MTAFIGFTLLAGTAEEDDDRSLLEWWQAVTGPGCRADATNIEEEIRNCDEQMELKHHPDQVSPALARGILKRRKGDLHGAISDFGLALEKHPRFRFLIEDLRFF